MGSFNNRQVSYGKPKKKENVMRFLFIIVIGILLSALVATAIGSLSGALINQLFLTVNETLTQ